MGNEIIDLIYDILLSPEFYIPVITLVISLLIQRIVSILIKKGTNKKSKSLEVKRKNTMLALLENVFKYILWLTSLLVILSSWGVNVSGILAGLGVAGVVAGLALQDALKDIIMGVNILVDNYYIVGDLVSIDDFTGEVIELGLKDTKVRNAKGEVLVIANRQISKVVNLSQKNSGIIIRVPIAYEEKEDKVKKVLTKTCTKISKMEQSNEDAEYLGIDELAESAVIYMIKAHCPAGEQFDYKRAILALIKNELEKNNVKIPYKQVEVHNGKRI